MKKINYTLIIGSLIVLFLLVISIYPEYFTQCNPYGKQYEKLTYVNGGFTGAIPPVAPCKEFAWGTDSYGRDMKSLVVYGARTTLIMALGIAIGRLLIAVPIAILAAYKNKAAAWLINQFNMIFTAFPLVLIVIIMTRMSLLNEIFGNMMTPAALVLMLCGWAKIAKIITQRVEEVLSNDFIEGEIAIGKNNFEIITQNIIPHIVPCLVITLFLEVAMVLITLAQIGVMGTIVYRSFYNAEGDMNTPMEFDWPSLLIFSYHFVGTDKMWLILYPAIAFSISIIGFNLFGEGLRYEFDKKNSKVISTIKKTPSILSPMRYLYQIRNFRNYKPAVITKTVACMLIISMMFIPQPDNLYKLNAQSAFNTIDELKKLQATDINEYANEQEKASNIEERLKACGVMPWKDEFSHPYEFRTYKRKIQSLNMSIQVDNQDIQIEYGKDCFIRAFEVVNKTFDVKKVQFNKNKTQIINIKDTKRKLILVDARDTSLNDLYNVILRSKIDPIGIIYVVGPTKEQMEFHDISYAVETGSTVMMMASDTGAKLLNGNDVKMKLNIIPTDSMLYANNVIGYIPGTDENLKDEYIIIGCPLDYQQDGAAGGVALALQIAEDMVKNNIKPKRTVVFAFWGGDLEDTRGSKEFEKKYLMGTDKRVFYIDLKDITNTESSDILVDVSMIKPKNKIEQSYIKILSKYAEINDINLKFGSIVSPYAKDYFNTNMNAMVISSPKKAKLNRNETKLESNIINEKKYNRASQTIFNTLAEIVQVEQ